MGREDLSETKYTLISKASLESGERYINKAILAIFDNMTLIIIFIIHVESRLRSSKYISASITLARLLLSSKPILVNTEI